MAQAQELRQAINSMADRRGPILSAYLSVNANNPENQRRAYLVRLRDAMNDEGVPKDLQQRIRDYLEEETHPAARTLAVFADEDDLFEVYRLQVDVPESARWGDPNVGPLTLVLDEYEPYGAAVLDAERFRYFVVSPLSSARGEEEVKANGFREIDLHPSEPYPRGGGSTDLDPAGRKHEANIHSFYKELGERTRNISFQEGVQRLILAGPKERTAEFRRNLPNELGERVVAEEHVDIGESEGELLDDLEAIRERAERGRQKELLDEIRERGVRGPDETIAALQEENRVYHLAALWEIEADIRWCDNDGLAIQDATAEECPFCGQKTRVRPLTDVLIDLSAARGARLDFMLGENENTDVLRDEFGGIAGLTRF
jgi:peptide subunit release factor 1 (eRF1)